MKKRVLKYSQQHQAEKGFTLIEILMAIFITAIVTTIVYSSLFQIIEAKEKVESQLHLLHEARTIFSRISKDLENAYPRGRVSGIAREYPALYFLGKKDKENNDNSTLTLSSYTRGVVDLGEDSIFNRQSNQSEVTYFLEKLEDRDNLYALIRRENPWFGNPVGGTQYAISERVSKFRLTYLNNKKIEPESQSDDIEEWNANTLGGAYPKAVEVKLVLKDDLGENWEFKTTISIPATK